MIRLTVIKTSTFDTSKQVFTVLLATIQKTNVMFLTNNEKITVICDANISHSYI